MIVDRAIYREGRRTAEPLELGQMDDAFRAGGGLAWVGLGHQGKSGRDRPIDCIYRAGTDFRKDGAAVGW